MSIISICLKDYNKYNLNYKKGNLYKCNEYYGATSNLVLDGYLVYELNEKDYSKYTYFEIKTYSEYFCDLETHRNKQIESILE